MSGRLGERIESYLEQENGIDQWWASHGKAIKETFERYKVWVSIELRKTQARLAQVTEERDQLIKQTLALSQQLARIREAVK